MDRRALLLFAKELGERDGVIKMLRQIDQAVLAGTFEGHLDVPTNANGRLDYCDIQKGAWWFDGLLAWKCKPVRPGTPDDESTSGADAEAATEVK